MRQGWEGVKERGAGRACDVCACVGACECLCERARKRDGAAADSGIRARQEDCKASPPSRASPVNQVPYFEARTRGREEEEVGSLPSPAFSEPTYTSTHARPRACTCAPVRRSLTVRSLSSLALFRHSRCFVTRAVSSLALFRHSRCFVTRAVSSRALSLSMPRAHDTRDSRRSG